MSMEESKAALGNATYLQEQLLMQQNAGMGEDIATEAPIEPQEAPTEDLDVETEEEPEEDMKAEFDDFKKEVKKMVKEEIGGIKEMINSALKDEEE